MTDKQQAALKKLEAAFKACGEAGLAFVGMDNNLHVYDAKALRAEGGPLNDLYAAQIALGQGQIVETHGAYRDSGGW